MHHLHAPMLENHHSPAATKVEKAKNILATMDVLRKDRRGAIEAIDQLVNHNGPLRSSALHHHDVMNPPLNEEEEMRT